MKWIEDEWWNLDETMVWLAFRSKSAIEKVKVSSCIEMALSVELADTYKEFWAEFVDAARAGQITVYGTERGSNTESKVNTVFWKDVNDFTFRSGDAGFLIEPARDNVPLGEWNSYLLNSKNVLKRWQDVSVKKKKPGRPAGSGGYTKQDEPLLEKMMTLLKKGEAKSVWTAAKRYETQAKGSTEKDARTQRLYEKFRKKHPEFPN